MQYTYIYINVLRIFEIIFAQSFGNTPHDGFSTFGAPKSIYREDHMITYINPNCMGGGCLVAQQLARFPVRMPVGAAVGTLPCVEAWWRSSWHDLNLFV